MSPTGLDMQACVRCMPSLQPVPVQWRLIGTISCLCVAAV